MSKLEKRLIIFAIIFVLVYVGAIIATVRSRVDTTPETPRLESATPTEQEGRLMMVELLLPMAVLFAISVCFIWARKKRLKTYQTLDELDDTE